jgi:hypothetical protein
MNDLRHVGARVALAVILVLAAVVAWELHADAWDLGDRSPVLSYDAAQYAVAARELAEHGRLATTFALPVELGRHPEPPWPLSLVQPGLVLVEAALFRALPEHADMGGRMLWRAHRPDQREWLVIAIPFACFVLLTLTLGLSAYRVVELHVPDSPEFGRVGMGLAVGAAFVLDPEAQHFAVGGFTELPFTLALAVVIAGLAVGRAARAPVVAGLLLGLGGLFRGVTLWMAPAVAIAVAAAAERGSRRRVLLTTLGTWALVLAPWWLYKWSAFGDPGWDLSRWSLWDGVQGRTWFSVFHTAEAPEFPAGAEALRLVAMKVARNLPRVLLALSSGLGALHAGALALALVLCGWPRAARAAGWAILAVTAACVLTAAASEPLLRYVFPARVPLEAAGLLALVALAWRYGAPGAARRRVLAGAAVVVALAWGGWRCSRGLAEARAAASERGTPRTETLMQLTVLLNRQLPHGETVMSNLGPALAWTARRPVVHLALDPEGIADVRRHLDVRHVLLVFRDAEHAWPGWSEVVAHPLEATSRPEWNVKRVRVYRAGDGFSVVWLELGPRAAGLATIVRP